MKFIDFFVKKKIMISKQKEFESRIRKIRLSQTKETFVFDHPIWNRRHVRKITPNNFRSDNVFVWQSRGFKKNEILESYLWVEANDHEGLLDKLIEDGSFGVDAYNYKGRLISRDLIDSFLEINFIKNSLFKIPGSILDIGAGYGRLAYRLCQVTDLMQITCIDAVPIATAVSEIYLKEPIKKGRVKVLSLNEVNEIKKGSIELATNIHSFSEMSLNDVRLWVNFVASLEVPYLFIVPNRNSLQLNDGQSFGQILEEFEYRVFVTRSKYELNGSKYDGIYPATYFMLRNDKFFKNRERERMQLR
jgi:putative sugar O-methyltransferase